MKTVLVATNNPDKAREIAEILNIEGWEFKTLKELGFISEPDETGTTFAQNAAIKAHAAWGISNHMPTLADDSGLCVDALNGAPGIYSARYAGLHDNDKANNAKLLAELKDVPFEKRTAHYICALHFIDEDGTEITCEGTFEGVIGFEERGSCGFGYDPLFYPNAYNGKLSCGEISAEEKDSLSHRGNALRILAKKLSSIKR